MPFIGRWKFLTLSDAHDSRYQQALFRLRLSQSRDTLLDLGCGLGQALRQFRDDGVDGSRLFGLDSSSQLISSGYDLFQDRSSLDAHFTVGDIIDPDDPRLDELNGLISIIHAGASSICLAGSSNYTSESDLSAFYSPRYATLSYTADMSVSLLLRSPIWVIPRPTFTTRRAFSGSGTRLEN